MNNFYTMLNNLQKGASKEMFASDFYKNLKRFQFLINERFVVSSAILDDFLKAVPQHILDLTNNENCLSNMFSIAEEYDHCKILLIEPLDEEEVGIKLVFDITSKLVQIQLVNDRIQLTLNSKDELVRFDMQEKSLQLTQIFTNYLSLNRKKKDGDEFQTIATFETESIDRKMRNRDLLLG